MKTIKELERENQIMQDSLGYVSPNEHGEAMKAFFEWEINKARVQALKDVLGLIDERIKHLRLIKKTRRGFGEVWLKQCQERIDELRELKARITGTSQKSD